MQQTLDAGFWRSARFPGVLRYQWKALGRTVSLVLLILLGTQLLSLVFPMLTGNAYPYLGVYADLSATLVVALVCACIAAGKSTRFLLRFGTSRLSVWLGNLVGLWAGMVGLLLGTFLLSLLIGGLVLGLSAAVPTAFRVKPLFADASTTVLFRNTLNRTLADLPKYSLYVVEWTSIFYLFGCCLRRNRALTLSVMFGVPMLLMLLTLIPAVRQAVDVMENANDRQMMLLGVQWMKYLADAMKFIRDQWPMIQLIGAAVSLPLSYLCMRGTQQP